jgi:ribonuclease HII
MKYIGIDEAGRGPVIGPMIIAGLLVKEEHLIKLKEKGVKDSKLLNKKKIFELGKWLTEEFEYKLEKVWPDEIDARNINEIELERFAKIINDSNADIAIVDAPSANEKKIEDILKSLTNKNVIARNFADRDFIQVSGASIIAKMFREIEVSKLKELIGDFGSGYPSDPKTKEFIKKVIKEGKVREYRKYVRLKWYTSQPNLLHFS